MSSTRLQQRSAFRVRTGTSEDLGIELQREHSRVLVISYPEQDLETVENTFEVFEKVAELTPTIVQRHRERKLEMLVEALVPEIELSPTQVVEARMQAAAKTHILQSGDFLQAAEISRLGGYSEKNPSAQPHRWKSKGMIFAISHKGVDYYPLYALNPDNNYRPYPVMADILHVLQASKDAWGIAYWFASVNGYLDNQRPQDLLKRNPELVVEAAKEEAAGLQHG
jgi:hypothetical protein